MNEDYIIMLCVEYFLLSLGFHNINVKRMSSDAKAECGKRPFPDIEMMIRQHLSHSHSVTDNRQFGR